MHTSVDFDFSSIPVFLTKLWKLVEDESRNELICWDPSGRSFHVFEQDRFAKEILPLYFKHNNMASFVRQLNMYGFRKVVSAEPQNIKAEIDDVAFMHPYFIRGEEVLLENIKRKVSTKSGEESLRKEEELNQVLSDVTIMKGQHDVMESQLENLKRENKRLWRDIAFLRQQQQGQSQVVQKLIKFLVSLMNKGRSQSQLGTKRRMAPLMIEDGLKSGESLPAKISRQNVDADVSSEGQDDEVMRGSEGSMTIEEIFDLGVADESDVSVGTTNAMASSSLESYQSMFRPELEPLALLDDGDDDITGALQLTDDLLNNTHDNEDPGTGVNEILVYNQPQGSQVVSRADSVALSCLQDPLGYKIPAKCVTQPPDVTTVALSDPLLTSDFDKAEMSQQLDSLQANIDNIRDLFARGEYHFDANTLFGLFNGDQSNPSSQNLLYDLNSPDYCENENVEDIRRNRLESTAGVQGNEVIEYVPQEDLSSLFCEWGDLENPLTALVDQTLPTTVDVDYISTPVFPPDYVVNQSPSFLSKQS